MTPRAPEPEPVPPGRLDDRVLLTLEEMHGRIAFSGLRRTLGAHPESLSRALRRLEREGLVERSQQGYRSMRRPAPFTGPGAELHSVAHIEVPPGVEAESVLARLSGRWFGSLRWMGVVDRPHEQLLAWARRDGTGSVLLGAEGGALRIFTSGESGLEDGAEEDDAAYELLLAVAETLRPAPTHAGVTFLSALSPCDSPAGSSTRLARDRRPLGRNN
jgi:DNA-binding transcriptional ArsR family regulator